MLVERVAGESARKKSPTAKVLFSLAAQSSDMNSPPTKAGVAVDRRDLESVVALAEERHFGHAAERLQISPPSLSELIRRLEAELGVILFVRTTRRVTITDAGAELLDGARRILHDLAALEAAARLTATGESGTIRLGITPPAANGLTASLLSQVSEHLPNVTVEQQVMWRPDLTAALSDGRVDAAITFGNVRKRDRITSRVLCAQPIQVAVRPSHHLAQRESVSLRELEHEVLGLASSQLFPAWASYQRQALEAAGVAPPTTLLEDHSLDARRWFEQKEITWTLLLPALAHQTVTIPIAPLQLVPFTLEWRADGSEAPAVHRFAKELLAAELPVGWRDKPDASAAAAVVVA
jgi:DNA-binding transcriptional LysR family regulator